MLFDGYDSGDFFDEMFDAQGKPRPAARLLFQRVAALGDGELRRYKARK